MSLFILVVIVDSIAGQKASVGQPETFPTLASVMAMIPWHYTLQAIAVLLRQMANLLDAAALPVHDSGSGSGPADVSPGHGPGPGPANMSPGPGPATSADNWSPGSGCGFAQGPSPADPDADHPAPEVDSGPADTAADAATEDPATDEHEQMVLVTQRIFIMGSSSKGKFHLRADCDGLRAARTQILVVRNSAAVGKGLNPCLKCWP
jgi:hypothetical protein